MRFIYVYMVLNCKQIDELDVHLPEGHLIGVPLGSEIETAERELERRQGNEERITQLTAYFKFNAEWKEAPLGLTYANAYKKLRYDLSKKEWTLYKGATREANKLCRIKSVNPTNLQLNVLTILLMELLFVFRQ